MTSVGYLHNEAESLLKTLAVQKGVQVIVPKESSDFERTAWAWFLAVIFSRASVTLCSIGST